MNLICFLDVSQIQFNCSLIVLNAHTDRIDNLVNYQTTLAKSVFVLVSTF